MERNEHPDDPFYRELRRRHPEVDLVLLPAETSPAAPVPGAEEAAAGELIRVAVRARRLWRAISPDGDHEPDLRFRFGADASCVRPVATATSRREDGDEVLTRLRLELESHGWEVHRPDGTVERLSGGRGELEVSASYAEALGVLVLSMRGPSIPVGRSRARELTAAGRRG